MAQVVLPLMVDRLTAEDHIERTLHLTECAECEIVFQEVMYQLWTLDGEVIIATQVNRVQALVDDDDCPLTIGTFKQVVERGFDGWSLSKGAEGLYFKSSRAVV